MVLETQVFPSYVCVCVCAQPLSHIQLFVTPWAVARQAPLSMRLLQATLLEWVAMLCLEEWEELTR